MAESPKEELARRIGEYPKEALPYFNQGFVSASKLSEETRRLVLAEVIASFKRGTRRLDGAALRPLTKLNDREVEQLASVYSLVIGLLSESSATTEDFIASAKGILFLPEQESTAQLIAASVCASRQEIRLTVDRAQLAGEILPSLFVFDIAVDIRIRVVDGEVKTFVPVAIVHLDTDADSEEVWFQMSRGDVEDTISKLTNALDDMKLAETMTPRKN
jgi:hypothetical protein